ncbi:MAG: SDR family oxidoreductase [Pseudomonadota bacterium]
MAEPLRLYGMKAVVTQAGSGIGEAIARTLVKHGAGVIAIDDSNSGIEQLFKPVKGVTGIVANYRDARLLPSLVEEAREKLGGIDILINEFSVQPESPLKAVKDELQRILDIRAELTLAMCRAALPHMKRSPAGRIINVGFLRSVFAADAANVASRAEQNLAALTRALAVETGAFGITANYIQPGGIMTPASRDVFRKDKELRDFCISRSAAKRIGEPVDVAKVALFLASDDAVFVSGTGIAVDGGRVDS